MNRYALTVKQPSAALLVFGLKRFETRGWRFGEQFAGQRLYIHAGADRNGLDFLTGVDRVHVLELLAGRPLHYGALVGSVTLGGAFRMGSPIGPSAVVPTGGPALWNVAELVLRLAPSLDIATESMLGDFSDGRWAWECRQPIALKSPVPTTGHLGIFRLPPAVAEVAEAELA